jgi:lipoprotein-anchoring transpeptidase ErfK/SrfK
MHGRLILVPVLTVALAATGCGGHQPVSAPFRSGGPSVSPTTTSGAVRSTTGPVLRAVPKGTRALVVRRRPAPDGVVLTRLAARTELGSPRVLLVRPPTLPVPGWVRVALPVRPNGSTGWVAADDVRLRPVDDRIVIDLSRRLLVLTIDGKRVRSTRVAIGTRQHPTPVGYFYVTDRVRIPDPSGAYGPFALGLSAHSDTLTSFGGGDGQVGIHGTNEPGSIGRAVSHGCLRVPNAVAELLAGVQLGTPVVVRA